MRQLKCQLSNLINKASVMYLYQENSETVSLLFLNFA